jgi:hypothetical protein
MYKIRDFAKLPHVSHIIWDIDGTITDPDGELSPEVAAKIIRLATKGVYHSFITGRDADWIVKNVIEPMRQFFGFSAVRNNLIFFAEVGSIMIDEVPPTGRITWKVVPELVEHPLVDNQARRSEIRANLRKLAYDPPQLEEYKGGPVDSTKKVVYDAGTRGERKGYLVDVRTTLPLHPYIWSTSKQVIGTFEVIRNELGKTVPPLNPNAFVEIVRKKIHEGGMSEDVEIEPVSTAINVVPVVRGKALGKAWAAGKALEHIQAEKLGRGIALATVVQGTIAVGDGRADFDFTEPRFTEVNPDIQNLPLVFVGPPDQVPEPNSETGGSLSEHMIIEATGEGAISVFIEKGGVIELHKAMGARVVSAVLDFLNEWGYFSRFAG